MANIKRTPNDNPVIDRIEFLLASQKRNKKELISYIGLTESAFTNWRYGSGKSYLKYIDKIAEFLGVNASYLLYGVDEHETAFTLSEDERRLVQHYRQLDDARRKALLSVATLL